MKNNKLIILGGMVLVLALISFVAKYKKRESIVDAVKFVSLFPSTIDKNSIDKIEILTPDEVVKDEAGKDKNQAKEADQPIDFTKLEENRENLVIKKNTKGMWKMPSVYNASADKSKVESLLKSLQDLNGEFRSDTKEVLADYELEDKKAMRIALYQKAKDKPIWTLMVGKNADYSTHFVRTADSNSVYVVNKNLRSEVGAYSKDKGPDYKKFVDLNMYTLETIDDVNEIEFSSSVTKFKLVKETVEVPAEEKNKDDKNKKEADKSKKEQEPKTVKKDVWKVKTKNFAFNLRSDGVKKLLGKIKKFKAKEIVGGANEKGDSKFGLSKSKMNVLVKTKGDKKWEMSIGKQVVDGEEKKDEFYVQNGKENNIYSVTKYNVMDLFVKGQDVFDLEVLKLDREQIASVSINDGKNLYTVKRNKKKKWTLYGLKKKEKLNDSALNNLIKNISKVKGYGVSFQSTPKKHPKYHATIKMKDGNKHKIEVASREIFDEIYSAKVSGISTSVLIRKSQIDDLFPSRSKLIAENKEK